MLRVTDKSSNINLFYPTKAKLILLLCSLFSRNRRSTRAIRGMKFHDPPVGSGLGPRQE